MPYRSAIALVGQPLWRRWEMKSDQSLLREQGTLFDRKHQDTYCLQVMPAISLCGIASVHTESRQQLCPEDIIITNSNKWSHDYTPMVGRTELQHGGTSLTCLWGGETQQASLTTCVCQIPHWTAGKYLSSPAIRNLDSSPGARLLFIYLFHKLKLVLCLSKYKWKACLLFSQEPSS